MAQAGALSGTLDDAGNIGHDEGHALVHEHHAQVGEEGGKVIVSDFRPGLGRDRQQGGLAHVGEADEAHVRQQLQLQQDRPFFSGQTGLGELGGLAGGGGEVLVAPAAVAAAAEDEGLVGGHVHDDLFRLRIPDHGAPRHFQDQGSAVFAGALLAGAVAAVLGDVFALVAEVHQGGHAVVYLQDHVAAAAAVAAVRAAGCHVFFPVKGHRAVAAGPGLDQDAGGVDECVCHGAPPLVGLEEEKAPNGVPFGAIGCIGSLRITPQWPPRWKPACGPCPAAQT